MLDAKTVAQLISANPAGLQQLGQLSAVALKKLHAITPDEGDFPNKKEYAAERVKSIAKYLEDDETQAILDYIESIPDSNTFLHGDYNAKNVMVKDGEVLLIDIGDAAVGHPAFDIAGLILTYLIMPNATDPERVLALLGFDPALAQNMWGVMCGTYFMAGDPQEIGRITNMLMPLALLLMTYMLSTTALWMRHPSRSVLEDKALSAFLADLIEKAEALDVVNRPREKVQIMTDACQKARAVDTKDPYATYEAAKALAEAYDALTAD